MIRTLFVFVLVAGAVLGGRVAQARPQGAAPPVSSDHVKWVANELKKMQTIKPGMTRGDLLKVFRTEGGLFQRERRRYVSRDCPYFKVDVVFKAFDGTRPGPNVGIVEDERDVITKISKPFLEFSVID